MNQIVHFFAKQLITRPAEQALRLGIDEGAATTGVIGDNAFAKRIGQTLEKTIALGDYLFLLFQSQRGMVKRFDQRLDFNVAVIGQQLLAARGIETGGKARGPA